MSEENIHRVTLAVLEVLLRGFRAQRLRLSPDFGARRIQEMVRLFDAFWVNRPSLRHVALLPLVLCACKSDGLDSVSYPSRPGEAHSFSVLLAGERSVDILFMVDNSMAMDPKQEALAKALPKMTERLQSLSVGSADLHIGVISSDMDAGSGEGGCNSVLGNQGILWGNDTSVDPNRSNNKYATVKDIKNAAGYSGCGMDSGARWIEDVQNSNGVGRTRNYQGSLTDVLTCLTKAVGVSGCGYEHQLQSVRVALNPMENINAQNVGFLRRKAYLAIVLVTDEDDCSAEPNNDKNDGMFAARTLGDTASLRCAARGHVCNQRDIPDYDPLTGYTGKAPFVARFSECDAKDDPKGSSRDYKSLPLIRVRDMIDSVNQVKERPTEQITAYGIIGWPENPGQAEYRIDKDTTSLPTEQRKLWDYMPVCQTPGVKSADGNIYKAYGGLRLKKFLDAYKGEGQTNVLSICNPDFPDAMTSIGESIAGMLDRRLRCVSLPLADADPDFPGVQPECHAELALSCDTPGQGDCRTSGYVVTPIGQCRDGQGHSLDIEAPSTDSVSAVARPCWYFQRDPSCGDPQSLRPKVLTVDAQAPLAGTLLNMECMTCPDGQPGCLF
jgi:hypothetical protein